MRDFRWPPPPDSGPRSFGPGPTAPRSGRPTLPEPPTELIGTPHGVALERLVTGAGEPVTVFAHGLGAGIADTRPLGSGVAGRRVFFAQRGHGRSAAPPGPWDYADFARDLRAVADLSGATRAVGASLGAAALCRLLVESPQRFTHAVFFLPAVFDQPRSAASRARLTTLLEAVQAGEVAAVADAVAAEIPAGCRNTPAGWAYVRQRIDQLLRDGLAPALSGLTGQVAVPAGAALGSVTARTLVIGCVGDELHPVAVSERLAAALPAPEVEIFDRPAVFWTARSQLRERISGFLNG